MNGIENANAPEKTKNTARKRGKNWMRYVVCALSFLLCALMIARGDAVRAGAAQGLRACAQVVIPSLYLFMAAAGFISLSEAGRLLARPLAPLTRFLFRLPECMGTAVVLSCIGGYPVGAKAIASLLDAGKATRDEAQRALCFCCNAGPSFVVTAVGAGMLGSVRAGAILLAAHLGSAALIGFLLSLRCPVPARRRDTAPALPFSEAFIAGVNNATSGILSICAFVVFFSAFGALLESCGLTTLFGGETGRAVLVGLLEVTSGCIAAAALPGSLPLILIPLFLSFAGFSILFQVRSILAPYRLRFGGFYLCRVLHAVLTLAFSYPIMRRALPAVGAFGSLTKPILYRTPNTPAATTLMLLVCALVLLRLTAPRHSS